MTSLHGAMKTNWSPDISSFVYTTKITTISDTKSIKHISENAVDPMIDGSCKTAQRFHAKFKIAPVLRSNQPL